MVTAVLLDLYDTLICANWHHVVSNLVTRLGIDERRLLGAFEVTREGRGTGRYGSARGDIVAVSAALGLSLDDALVGELEAELIERLAGAVRVYEDVPRFLAMLRGKGVKSAIVSNCDYATRALLERVPLPLDVDSVVLSCEAGCVKPHADIFARALDELGATPEEALFVDDQASYLDGARALGIRTFRIVRDESYGEPSRTGTHAVVRSLDELVLG